MKKYTRICLCMGASLVSGLTVCPDPQLKPVVNDNEVVSGHFQVMPAVMPVINAALPEGKSERIAKRMRPLRARKTVQDIFDGAVKKVYRKAKRKKEAEATKLFFAQEAVTSQAAEQRLLDFMNDRLRSSGMQASAIDPRLKVIRGPLKERVGGKRPRS